jgi:tRNA(Ile)-lysidine synthase
MGGMRELSGRLLRPLLAVGKADLLAYAKQHKLAWAEDYTNKDSKYTRNFIRLKVLPLLAGINAPGCFS